VQQTVAASGKDVVAAAVEAGVREEADIVVVVDVDGAKGDRVLVIQRDIRGRLAHRNGRPRMNKKLMSVEDLMARLRRIRIAVEEAR